MHCLCVVMLVSCSLVVQCFIQTDIALIEVLGPVGDKGVGDDEDIEFSDQFALFFCVGRVVPMIPLTVCTVDIRVCHCCLRCYHLELSTRRIRPLMSLIISHPLQAFYCDIEAKDVDSG
jgi:hypothetical protein